MYSHVVLQKVQTELEGIKKDLDKMVEKSEAVLATSQQSSSAPVLRSEIDITQKKMEHAYSLSSVYLDKWVSSPFFIHVYTTVLKFGLGKLF